MPRAGLSEARVVAQAQLLADETGISRLTLAALAERLGVRQPSLYKHIEGMDGLQRSLALAAKLELADVLTHAAVGRERGVALASICRAYRAWALEYPARYAVVQRAPAPDDPEDNVSSAAVVGVVAEVMAGYHLRDDDAVDAIRALRSALHGFVSLETGGAFGLPVDVERSFDRMVAGLQTAFAQWVSAESGAES